MKRIFILVAVFNLNAYVELGAMRRFVSLGVSDAAVAARKSQGFMALASYYAHLVDALSWSKIHNVMGQKSLPITSPEDGVVLGLVTSIFHPDGVQSYHLDDDTKIGLISEEGKVQRVSTCISFECPYQGILSERFIAEFETLNACIRKNWHLSNEHCSETLEKEFSEYNSSEWLCYTKVVEFNLDQGLIEPEVLVKSDEVGVITSEEMLLRLLILKCHLGQNIVIKSTSGLSRRILVLFVRNAPEGIEQAEEFFGISVE